MSSQSKREVLKRGFAKSARVTSLLWLVGVGACTSILGVEDLHEGPKPGSETNAGQGGETTNVTGGSKNGGGNNGGSSNGGAGNAAPGGEGGASVTPVGGEAGAGGEGGAPATLKPVTGKIINQWYMPVGNVTVQIGKSQVVTDDKGNFTIPDVEDTYDLSLKNGEDGWVFQGLHRRDPTLEVINTDSDLTQSAAVTPTVTNATKGVNDRISFAVGTPTGNARNDSISYPVDVDFDYINVYWLGGNTTISTAHALEWTLNGSTQLPLSYKAYDHTGLPLAAGVEGKPSFNLKASVINSKAITGTASAAGTAAHSNLVFVRFLEGTWIKLIDDSPPKSSTAFSYVVPELPESSIEVVTYQGSFSGRVGSIHKGGFAPGDAVGALVAPRPPTLLKPQPNATNVTAASTFSIAPSAENKGAFVYVISPEMSPGRLFVVTTQTTLLHLPDVVDGSWLLPAGSDIDWWVETHGDFSNVDDMTGPNGFIDLFGLYYEVGERIGSGDDPGSWTSTESIMFSTP